MMMSFGRSDRCRSAESLATSAICFCRVDGEPMEVVDDVAAGRMGSDDLLDDADMEGIARGEVFRLLGWVQFGEDVAHAGCLPGA